MSSKHPFKGELQQSPLLSLGYGLLAQTAAANNSYVCHYSVVPNETVIHGTVTFSQFASAIVGWNTKYLVAKRVVRALRRNAKYSELLSEFDRGVVDKDEFKRAAAEFVVDFRALSPEETKLECEITIDLTGESSLSSDEFGAMLDFDPMQLELTLISRESYPALQPSERPSIG